MMLHRHPFIEFKAAFLGAGLELAQFAVFTLRTPEEVTNAPS
jgi:hypothetical protein